MAGVEQEAAQIVTEPGPAMEMDVDAMTFGSTVSPAVLEDRQEPEEESAEHQRNGASPMTVDHGASKCAPGPISAAPTVADRPVANREAEPERRSQCAHS